jgi:hypothetical protein
MYCTLYVSKDTAAIQPGEFSGVRGMGCNLVNKFPYSFLESRGFIAGTNDNQVGLYIRGHGNLSPNEPVFPGLRSVDFWR